MTALYGVGGRCAVLAASAAMWLVMAAGSAEAVSFKSTMSDMGRTIKVAKTAVASSDAAKAQDALQAFANEARTALALFPGSSAKARDFRQRFTALLSTAERTDPARFRAAFGDIVDQCRSCHSAYK